MKLLLLLIISFFLFMPHADAGQGFAYYDGNPLEVIVSVGRVTEIVFPQKISKVINGGQTQHLLLEVLDNTLFVLPKQDKLPDIFITSVNGVNYPLKFNVSKENQTRLTILDAFGDGVTAKGGNRALNLIKVLMRGGVPAQAVVRDLDETIDINQGRIKLQLFKSYELAGLKGYVLKAKNMTQEEVDLSLETIQYPGLLAIASDSERLFAQDEQGNETFVYMVTR